MLCLAATQGEVTVTRVQPRVLTVDALGVMADKLEKWCGKRVFLRAIFTKTTGNLPRQARDTHTQEKLRQGAFSAGAGL